MPIPANNTPGTAIDLTGALPFTGSQDAHFAGTTYPLWYRYTAQAGDAALSIIGFAGVSYAVQTNLYLPPNFTTPVLSTDDLIPKGNKPVCLPLGVPGVEYYLRFAPEFGNPSPAIVQIAVETMANSAVPAGSIVGQNGFLPFAPIVSATTDNTVLAYLPFPINLHGASLPTGRSLIDTDDQGNLSRFSIWDAALANVVPDIALPANISIPLWLQATPQADAWHVSGGFFSGGFTYDRLAKLLPDGTYAQQWTIPTAKLAFTCVSPDEAIVYYTETGLPSASTAVKQASLLTSTVLADLTPAISGEFPWNLLVMDDGTIAVLYRDVSSVTNVLRVRTYSPAGALLQTMQLRPSGTITGYAEEPYLFYGLQSATSFWVSFHSSQGAIGQRYQERRVSDGAILTQVDLSEYQFGLYTGGQTQTPASKFGPDRHNVPFMMQATGPAPPVLPPGCAIGSPLAVTGNPGCVIA